MAKPAHREIARSDEDAVFIDDVHFCVVTSPDARVKEFGNFAFDDPKFSSANLFNEIEYRHPSVVLIPACQTRHNVFDQLCLEAVGRCLVVADEQQHLLANQAGAEQVISLDGEEAGRYSDAGSGRDEIRR